MQQASESECRFAFERERLGQGILRIAGVDEVGRGPLAGPVVAAAVVLPTAWIREGLPEPLYGLDDSKQVPAKRREAYAGFLRESSEVAWALGIVEADEIDRLNILRATHAAMVRALEGLPAPPEHVLVDGLPVRAITLPQTAIVRGDARSYSIAAASVIAKVTRDRILDAHHARWPGYGFAKHKGYPTPAHLDALRRLGPCEIHRRSFAPVAERPVQTRLFET
ncbi:MAG: ribonuclease HII [Verrucomicrobiales bacterium]|nr:ribonuclease HII [Verrucomicrobiales bacterium]